ncbi:MAG: DUF1223 domain-containing protein [Chthoniobacterales bacterium]
MRPTILTLLALAAALPSVVSAETTFTSPPTRAHLLELYTSEGCSSCPPAESWLSKLKDAPGLWTEFVPLAFHVDYWDRLGWRDPFASKAWTARQYRYSASWKSSSVYTPAFVLNGREWRNSGVPSASRETPGVLKISVLNPERVRVNFAPAKVEGRAYEVHVARLGFDVKINVKAGENRGRELLHDFVVLALAKAQLGEGAAEVALPAGTPTPGGTTRRAIVAWVTEAGGMEPLQAVGGWQP